ncbi:hypothetical protein FIBSPDRAFT_954805 [Athelia psychrophila]|uniref:C2H2-type domain-containing protein n=1 Tax=Athelia psychrophila TaxID=1759441 RepID=A0A166IUV6_9AGAM|nr:hypothetical protein FIBSPDRAFT_954805 [Fibularhizoctonia sp. CBS 109695]
MSVMTPSRTVCFASLAAPVARASCARAISRAIGESTLVYFMCSYCTRGFQQKSQLTNHENVHTGNTPHQCDMCGEAFKDPSSCCRHRKEQHEGDYICFVDGCGKSIARKSNFRKHLGWHKVYNSGMELEDHWQRRDASMPKRVAHSRRPVKRSGSSDSESPCSLGVDNGSFYRIDSPSSSNATPDLPTSLLPQSVQDFQETPPMWPEWVWSDADLLHRPFSSESSPSPPSMFYPLNSSVPDITHAFRPIYSNTLPSMSHMQVPRSQTISPSWLYSVAAEAPYYPSSCDEFESSGTTVPISRSLRP